MNSKSQIEKLFSGVEDTCKHYHVRKFEKHCGNRGCSVLAMAYFYPSHKHGYSSAHISNSASLRPHKIVSAIHFRPS